MSINPTHLPSRARELAEMIGLPALLSLVKWRGGAYICVPKRPTPDMEIVEHIGMEAARALSGKHGGESVEIPKCDRAVRDALYAQIAERRSKGESELAVALDTGFTTRWVREINRRARAR